MALDGSNGAVNVRDGLTLGGFTNEDFAILGECDDGWRGAHTFGVCDDGGFSTFENGNNGVRGSEVNTYCSSHVLLLL